MLDVNRDESLPAEGPNIVACLRRLDEDGPPATLVINGEMELVVRDAASFRMLVELAERVERLESLRASIEETRGGKNTTPAEDVLAELRLILSGPGSP